MPVHHDNTVVAPPGGTGRTDLNAGRLVAMVTQQQGGGMLILFLEEFELLFVECVFELLFPHPLDLVFRTFEFRDIVCMMTGLDTVFAVLCLVALLEIHHHGPPFGRQRFLYGLCIGRQLIEFLKGGRCLQRILVCQGPEGGLSRQA